MHANTGFHAGEMERKLDIKYNTAKKYLKIMTEMGLVELDKTQGKKNHYRIAKDRIMARYLKEEESEDNAQSEKIKAGRRRETCGAKPAERACFAGFVFIPRGFRRFKFAPNLFYN